MKLSINKGVGKSVEFQGLSLQYLLLLAGGLLGLFFLFVIMAIMGLPNTVSLAVVTLCGVALVWGIFTLNKRYGEHGMMKCQARSYHPRYIIRRETIHKLLRDKSHEKYF